MEEQTPCQDPCVAPKSKKVLWGLAYRILGTNYKGVALLLAEDAQQAEQVFKTNSAFNGTQGSIIISAVAQVPDITESGLCIEAYTEGNTILVNYGA